MSAFVTWNTSKNRELEFVKFPKGIQTSDLKFRREQIMDIQILQVLFYSFGVEI